MRISDWSSDVCSSDLRRCPIGVERGLQRVGIDRTHDVGRDDDHQLCLVALEAVALEQGAEDRQVAEAGDLGVLLARVVLDQAGDGEALAGGQLHGGLRPRSEEHTSELQSLMRITYSVLGLKKKK